MRWVIRWSWALLRIVASLGLAIGVSLLIADDVQRYRTRIRGSEGRFQEEQPRLSGARLGVNVALERYPEDDALLLALTWVRSTGLGVVRQRFSWAELEPEPGTYRWEYWDRVLPRVQEHGLRLIAVLDTSPIWARPAWEADNLWAPPASVEDYARFVRAFAQRYRHLVTAYQIWDEPNIYPHWGKGAIDPGGYVRLLRAGSEAIRSVDPDALIVAGGLAPNVEGGGRNMSDVGFLREIYRRGAGRYFDVLGVKAYGFWSGPDDRRVSPEVLNFSRVILLREEMIRRGEGHKPIWALEGGWCALPDSWTGRPSLQGSDRPFVQAERLGRALLRIQQEWPWMEVACLAYLQPKAPVDDPIWGYALLDPRGEPQLAWEKLYAYLSAGHSQYVGPTQSLPGAYQVQRQWLWAGVLMGGVTIVWCLWAAWRVARRLPWREAWERMREWWLAMPLWLQGGGVIVSGLAVVLAPWPIVRLGSLVLYGSIAALRPDWALSVAIACIPFAPLHVSLGPGRFSVAEISLLVALGAHLWARLASPEASEKSSFQGELSWFSLLDGAVLLLVLLGLGTSFVAEYRRVAFREWRTMVLEPALLYGLLRAHDAEARRLRHLMDVLWFSGVSVALYSLARYPFPGGAIEAEGVRRAHAFYGSPNNLALYLERIFPLGLAMLAYGETRWRRWLYGWGTLGVGLALLLTFSRGAWVLGVPATLVALACMQRRNVGRVVWSVLLVGFWVLALMAGMERLSSLLDFSRGTTFLRLSVWRAAWEMVKDHPWLGVGLDNFLYYYGDYIRPGAEVDRWLSHPHNFLLDFWLRLGVGGVVLIVWMLSAFAARSWRAYHTLSDRDLRAMLVGIVAGMAAFLAHGLIDSSFFVTELALWFMFALSWVSCLDSSRRALTATRGSGILEVSRLAQRLGD